MPCLTGDDLPALMMADQRKEGESMSYAKLRGKIREVFKTEEAFAAAMAMSKGSLSMRLNNKVSWTLDEVKIAKDLLGIEDAEIADYFFTPKVR